MDSDAFSKQILNGINPELPGPPAPRRKAGKDGAAQLDHWSHAVLMERAAYLRKLAKHGDGSDSETLKEYPHQTVTIFDHHTNASETYSGVPLMDLLAKLGHVARAQEKRGGSWGV